MASGGTEKRSQILPSMNLDESGFLLPKYDFAAEVPTPKNIGVSRGDSFGHVIDAARGIIYYTDVIGFGASTNSMTQGLPFNKLGINFFTKTGMTCTNGAEMFYYFEGIPKGDALGKRVGTAIQEMGYPAMKGLAPGILEDTKAALDPSPLIRSMFGSAYPVCEKKTLRVGDDKGQLGNSEDRWIKTNDVNYINGIPHQTRWVQKVDAKGNPMFVDRAEFDKTPKTQNFDGSDKIEGFDDINRSTIFLSIIFFVLAFAIGHK